MLQRYQHEFTGELLSESDDAVFWKTVQEFPSDFMQRQREGIILRVSTTLSDIGQVLKQTAASFISRVANGVTYLYFASWSGAARIWKSLKHTELALCSGICAPEHS